MIVLKKNCIPPELNLKEILRYAGCREMTEEIDLLLKECIKMSEGVFSYSVCYCEIPIFIKDGTADLSFIKTDSKNLIANLADSASAVLFAATVGIGIDRLIKKYQYISPAKAVMLQAIGTERIEALCNAFNNEITEKYKKENLYTRSRFSPGYGDFPLEAQRDIFRILDCYRQIGLSLNDSLLMSPSKSVTAIIGISDKKAECEISCNLCRKNNCSFRRR